MRVAALGASIVALLAVAGCSLCPAAPSPTPARSEGFAIYLLRPEIRPQQLAALSRLELDSQPLLSENDIIVYSQATHEIEMTTAGYERIHALTVPTSGTAFAVCVGGAPVYAGAFWVALSSQSFDGVVIEMLSVTREHPVLAIRLGYPASTFYRGSDPRPDARVLQALERAGKLR